jgi:hypothetical protein
VPDDVPQTVTEMFPNLLRHSRGAGAKRALEVCVLHQGQGSRRRAEDVVARCIHGPGQSRRQVSGGLSVQDGGQVEHQPTQRGGQHEGQEYADGGLVVEFRAVEGEPDDEEGNSEADAGQGGAA